MIDDKKVLAIIPARGGSKGLPRKNIRPLHGLPLVVWTIREAKKSKYIDRLILSSEDEEIISIAEEYGCEVPFVRPQELAEDETTGMDVIFHAMEQVPGYDLIVLLQPTSPLRTVADIDVCIKICHHRNAPACVTVTKVEKHPLWMYYLRDDDTLTPVITDKNMPQRRQDLPSAFVLNGAVYVGEREFLLRNKSYFYHETIAHIMPRERSVDIDSNLDFNLAETLI